MTEVYHLPGINENVPKIIRSILAAKREKSELHEEIETIATSIKAIERPVFPTGQRQSWSLRLKSIFRRPQSVTNREQVVTLPTWNQSDAEKLFFPRVAALLAGSTTFSAASLAMEDHEQLMFEVRCSE